MKKAMMIVLMAVTTLTMTAQNRVGRMTFQPKIGFNLADVTNSSHSDFRVGLAVGGEFEYGASPMVGLSFGALYSMQGADYDDGTLKIDYINIPVLANIYVARGFAVKMGLQPGIKVSASEVYTDKYHEVERDLHNVKSIDLSLPIGMSYEYRRFVFDLRYNLGLTKIASGSSSKNSVLQFTFGYKIPLR